MAGIETVRGRVDAARLGVTLMHEHIFVLDAEIAANYPEEWGDEDARVAHATARLNELKARGVDTIVDLTVIGLGRYIPRIQEIAAETDLNIIVATGIYTYCDLPHYFQYRGPGTVLGGGEPMTDMFVHDIQEGIAGTGVRAGILKCATDAPGLTPGVERILRATAQAHRRSDFHPHPRPPARGAGSAADFSRGGCGSVARGNRPFRRHHGHRVSGRADNHFDIKVLLSTCFKRSETYGCKPTLLLFLERTWTNLPPERCFGSTSRAENAPEALLAVQRADRMLGWPIDGHASIRS